MTDDTLDDLVRWALEHGTPDCQHHWTVTSACPLCLRGRIVRLAEAITALRSRVRELESLPVAEEVEAMALEWDRLNNFPSRYIDITCNTIAMLRSLSRQIAAVRAERDALRADAERWTFMRYLWVNGDVRLVKSEDRICGHGYFVASDFLNREIEGMTPTAAIDAAKEPPA